MDEVRRATSAQVEAPLGPLEIADVPPWLASALAATGMDLADALLPDTDGPHPGHDRADPHDEMVLRWAAPALGAALDAGHLDPARGAIYLEETLGHTSDVIAAAVALTLPDAMAVPLDAFADDLADLLEHLATLDHAELHHVLGLEPHPVPDDPEVTWPPAATGQPAPAQPAPDLLDPLPVDPAQHTPAQHTPAQHTPAQHAPVPGDPGGPDPRPPTPTRRSIPRAVTDLVSVDGREATPAGGQNRACRGESTPPSPDFRQRRLRPRRLRPRRLRPRRSPCSRGRAPPRRSCPPPNPADGGRALPDARTPPPTTCGEACPQKASGSDRANISAMPALMKA